MTPRFRRTTLALLAATAVLAAGWSAAGHGPAAGKARPAACDGAAEIDFACWAGRYEAMAADGRAGAAVRELERLRHRVGYLRAACHQLTHVIGRRAGAGGDIRAIRAAGTSCSSGFQHGVVEAVMTKAGRRAVMRDPASVCAPLRAAGRHSLAHYNCVHGMGHGFMEVQDSDVMRALDGCASLPDRSEREHCDGGVFMENLTAMAHPRRPSRFLRPRDPLYPCTAVATRHKHSCYIKQTAYVLYLRDDFAAAFRTCARSPDVAFRPSCYQGIGGDAAIRANKYVTGAAARRETIRALCDLAGARAARRECVVGVVTVIVRDGAEREMDVPALCASFRRLALRATCSRTHARVARRFGSQARRGGGERVAFDPAGLRAVCLLDLERRRSIGRRRTGRDT